MIRLTVTGNRFQGARACADRGIAAALRTDRGGSCDFFAGNQFEEAARAWQKEDPQDPPYPVGTCLCVYKFPDTGILGSREDSNNG
jgi:hypothetical protein